MPPLKIQVSWYWLLYVSVTTADKWRINTVRVRTLTPFFQRAALWTDSCVGSVESLFHTEGVRDGFWGGERCSASEALVLLKDTVQIKRAMGATCGHAGSRHPHSLRGPARARHRSLSQQGRLALGYKLAITPVWLVLFIASLLFCFSETLFILYPTVCFESEQPSRP